MTTARTWGLAFLAALVGCGSDAATKPPPAAVVDPVRLDATVYGPGEGAGFLRMICPDGKGCPLP